LLCGDALAISGLSCFSSPSSKAKVIVAIGSGFTLETRYKLTVKNLIFDFSDSLDVTTTAYTFPYT
jgi:hypothetical protein